jgi:tetratricopeptide (TPR) repeat protein
VFVFFFFTILVKRLKPKSNLYFDGVVSFCPGQKHDSTRVKILNRLCMYYTYYDQQKSIVYGKKSIEIARQAHLSAGEGDAFQALGITYNAKGMKDSALYCQEEALHIFEKINSYIGITYCYNSIGNTYKQQGKYSKALEYYIKVLKMAEKKNDSTGIAFSNFNIAAVYSYQSKYAESWRYYMKALPLSEAIKNNYLTAVITMNIGADLSEQKKFDEALEYDKKSLAAFELIGHTANIALTLGNISTIYANKKNYGTALEYAFKALKILEGMGNRMDMGVELNTIGEIYMDMKNSEKAIEYYEKAAVILKEVKNLFELKRSYEQLSLIYSKTGDYKQAYGYTQLYNTIKDTLFNADNTRQIAEINTKYETEKKDGEIKLLNKDKEARKLKERYTLLGLGLVIALAGVLLFAFYNKKKANLLLGKQKKEIEHQKEIIEEKNKEVMDSITYARRIQRALLTGEEYIRKNVPDFFILYLPKDIVSGDFYWANQHEGKFYMATADCTGHGVPGAFMSMLNISFLNEVLLERKITRPDLILNKVREGIIGALNPAGSSEESKDGMDCVLCEFDFSTRQLSYAAANNSFYIVRNGELIVQEADKMPVGKHHKEENKPFTLHTVALEKGDTVFTFTDGYADQFGGPKGKKFKYKQMESILQANVDLPMVEQKRVLEKTLLAWKEGYEQVDDVLVIGIKIS